MKSHPTSVRLAATTLERLGVARARLGGILRSTASVDITLLWLLEVGEVELTRLEALRLGGAEDPDPQDRR